MLKLGYAETDITPDTPMELVGFNRPDAIARGVLSPLLAQVSVWEGEERGCLITIDSLGFIKDLADALRIKVGSRLGIAKEKVMLCFSHCHSAPNVKKYPDYFEKVLRGVLYAVEDAVYAMEPVQIGYMNAEADIGVNRRGVSGGTDKRVGILKVCKKENQKMKLLCIRVTAHCNVLKSDNLYVSPDYFGEIREFLKKEYGCHVMVLQGSAGNVAPKYFDSLKTPVDAKGKQYIRSGTALRDMAYEVCGKLTSLVKELETTDIQCFKMYAKEICFCADVPLLEEAEKIAAEAKIICGIDGAAWLEEIHKLHNQGITCQQENAEVQYFMLDKFLLCGVPYELMVEFALDAVEKTNNPFFYINGYTNGCASYFPTEEEYERGGYEVYYSMLLYFKYYNRVFPLKKESARRLIEFMIGNAPDW